MSESLIFPIGHYVGSNYSASGADLESHIVRIGWRLMRLENLDQFAVWALAHGLPEGGDMEPWTRAATAGAARASGIPWANAMLAELAAADLVIEVEPGTDEATEFARVCRMRSLLEGLGDDDGDGRSYGIGWSVSGPAARVDLSTYELWKWAPTCESLWHYCEVLALSGLPDDDPTEVLTRLLPRLQVLLAHGAAFLDEAGEGWELEASAMGLTGLAD